MNFGVWTRKERAFLNADYQERGSLLHEPEGGPNASAFSDPLSAIKYGFEELQEIKNDNLAHSLIVTTVDGYSVLLLKMNEEYSIGFYNKELGTETYSTVKFENNLFDLFLKRIIKLEKIRNSPVEKVNLVTAEPPENENVAGKIIDVQRIFDRNVSFGKRSVSFGKQVLLAKVNSDIKYLAGI